VQPELGIGPSRREVGVCGSGHVTVGVLAPSQRLSMWMMMALGQKRAERGQDE